MSLAGVLSAMRVIILDDPDLPPDGGKRLEFFRTKFPDLTDHEAEDLAKMPPDRIRIYTNSIFIGEKRLIESNFPMTLAVLKKHWGRVFPAEFDCLEIVKDLHKHYAWKATDTVALGSNFVRYVADKFAPITALAPHLNEVSRFELIHREVKKSPDDICTAAESLRVSDIAGIKVEDLLRLKCMIPRCARFESFDFDIKNFRNSFIENKQALPGTIDERPVLYCCSRGRNTMPRWTVLHPATFSFLEKRKRGDFFEIEELAGACAEAEGADKTETELFASFIAFLKVLLDHGVIIAPLREKFSHLEAVRAISPSYP